MNNESFVFSMPEHAGSYVKVIGLGGGGVNAVNYMYRKGLPGVDFIVCNSDARSLEESPIELKIALGTFMLGAGANPERGRKMAIEKMDEIRGVLDKDTSLLFIVAGMGGGTGSGAAPVIAEIAKSINREDLPTGEITVVAVTTFPFDFEGDKRIGNANGGLEELRKYADCVITIPNESIRSFGDILMSEAFSKLDDAMMTAVKCINVFNASNPQWNRDFNDVVTILSQSGSGLFATGHGTGNNRIADAVNAAFASPFLGEQSVTGAKSMFVNVITSHEHEMTIEEYSNLCNYLSEEMAPGPNIMIGFDYDDSLGEEVDVSFVATNFVG